MHAPRCSSSAWHRKSTQAGRSGAWKRWYEFSFLLPSAYSSLCRSHTPCSRACLRFRRRRNGKVRPRTRGLLRHACDLKVGNRLVRKKIKQTACILSSATATDIPPLRVFKSRGRATIKCVLTLKRKRVSADWSAQSLGVTAVKPSSARLQIENAVNCEFKGSGSTRRLVLAHIHRFACARLRAASHPDLGPLDHHRSATD